MRSKFINLALFPLAFLLGGCGSKMPENYSTFLQNKPTSILVVMPTNETADTKAANAVLTNAILPLAEAGYYVMPVTTVNETFKSNGVREAAEIRNISPSKLKEIFGADAALYLNVTQYGTTYKIIKTDTVVSVNAKLVDLNTGTTLWQKSVTADDGSMNAGGAILNIFSPIFDAIFSLLVDKSYEIAANADMILLGQDCDDCLLYGPLSPNYGKDSQLQK